MQELWTSALSIIQNTIPATDWETWFQGTIGLQTAGGQLIVATGDEAQYLTLKEDFVHVIRASVHAAAGENVDVEFRFEPSLQPTGEVADTAPAVRSAAQADVDPQICLFDQLDPVDVRGRAPGAHDQAALDARAAAPATDGPLFAAAWGQPISQSDAWQAVQQAPQPTRTFEQATAASGLNPAFTFNSYVVGASNEFAFSAAQAAAAQPGKVYNPLFIYGGVGLGKTHLLNAIGCTLLRRDPGTRVRYLSGEALVNDLVNSIKSGSMEDFRQRTRTDVDLLLIDDIQFIAGKDRTQDEFFHIFNALHQAGKQIVVTSDRIPLEINLLEERIKSRLSMGLIIDIKPPDFETRMAIIRRRADQLGVSIPNDVVEFLARVVRANVRELHGTLNRVATYARHRKVPVTLDIAHEQLSTIYKEELSRPTPESILKATADYYNLRTTEILGRNRTARIAQARKVAMFVARKVTGASYPELGRFFGGRDHTTVLSACDSIARELETSFEIRQTIQGIERKLGGV